MFFTFEVPAGELGVADRFHGKQEYLARRNSRPRLCNKEARWPSTSAGDLLDERVEIASRFRDAIIALGENNHFGYSHWSDREEREGTRRREAEGSLDATYNNQRQAHS